MHPASPPCPLGYTAPRGRLMVTGIRHTAVLVLGCVLLALALSACGGTPQPTPAPTPDIEATVEARVETRVAEERAEATEATVEAVVEATVQAVLTEDNVLFPDASLDAAIREALGKAVQDKITTKELAELVELVGSGGIRDLTGLEYATNLTGLSLSSNEISDVSPLASLTNLTALSLYGNQISDISALASLTNLTSVNLRSNPLDLNDIQALRNRGVRVAIDD